MKNTLIGCRTLGGGLALVVFVSCAENGASDEPETADAKSERVALTFDEVLAESEDLPWLISDGEGGAYFVSEHGAWYLKNRWVEPVVPRPPPRKLKKPDPDDPFLKRLRELDIYEDPGEATDDPVEAEDGEGSP